MLLKCFEFISKKSRMKKIATTQGYRISEHLVYGSLEIIFFYEHLRHCDTLKDQKSMLDVGKRDKR